MFRPFNILLALGLITTPLFVFPETAEAGPLRDWIRNRRQARTQPVQQFSATGLQAGQCMQTCQQTCSRTVVNYVPHTAFRTEWKQVPVTQFRPVTNTDPCTGCTVTCMRPCTTFTYQAQRVPYTTFRPEYRTETFRVPVTTITNDCQSGLASNVPACATCVPANQMPSLAPTPLPSTVPQTDRWYEYPAGGSSQGTSIQGSSIRNEPADFAPTLNSQSSLRPALDYLQPRTQTIKPAPATYSRPGYSIDDLTASRDANSNSEDSNPVRSQWSYTPVRTASYVSTNGSSMSTSNSVSAEPPVRRYSASFEAIQRDSAAVDQPTGTNRANESNRRNDLNGWTVVK